MKLEFFYKRKKNWIILPATAPISIGTSLSLMVTCKWRKKNKNERERQWGLKNDIGDLTHGLSHAKWTFYQWRTSPTLRAKPIFSIWSLISFFLFFILVISFYSYFKERKTHHLEKNLLSLFSTDSLGYLKIFPKTRTKFLKKESNQQITWDNK